MRFFATFSRKNLRFELELCEKLAFKVFYNLPFFECYFFRKLRLILPIFPFWSWLQDGSIKVCLISLVWNPISIAVIPNVSYNTRSRSSAEYSIKSCMHPWWSAFIGKGNPGRVSLSFELPFWFHESYDCRTDRTARTVDNKVKTAALRCDSPADRYVLCTSSSGPGGMRKIHPQSPGLFRLPAGTFYRKSSRWDL